MLWLWMLLYAALIANCFAGKLFMATLVDITVWFVMAFKGNLCVSLYVDEHELFTNYHQYHDMFACFY